MNEQLPRGASHQVSCKAVVIWIDWYAYHTARFKGLQSAFGTNGEVCGVEMVGGAGVHKGYNFREGVSEDLPVKTLMPGKSWHEASQIGLAIALWRYLSSLSPKIVLVPGYYTLPAIAAAMWCKWKRCTSILMTETTAFDHARIGWRESIKSQIIRTLFDWAVTGGAAHDRYLLQLGFRSDRIVHFYDVVGNDRIRDAVVELRREASAFEHKLPSSYFLFVGRLSPEKNVVALINAWLSYRATGGVWSLVLAGDGPDGAALTQMVNGSAFATDVHFLGHRSAGDLLPVYAFANAFVLPSTREPWGLVVNEAMAAGLPVLVSNRCGCAETLVTPSENGFVFDPSNATELSERMQQISALPEQALAQLGRSSMRRISEFTPERFGQEILQIADGAEVVLPSGDGGWLQVLSHIDPMYGGLSAVVPRLADELESQESIATTVAAFCLPAENQSSFHRAQRLSVWPMSRAQWLFKRTLRRALRADVAKRKGLHIHGLWDNSTLQAVAAARRAGVPYIMSAHGMLERWAVTNKRFKKAIYAALVERRNVKGAAAVHALTDAEAEDYRRFGYSGPIAVIPNGIEAPPLSNPKLFSERFPQTVGKQMILFLGRIHFKKGVNLLLQAWSQLAARYPDVLLVIAGPDSEGTLADVLKQATMLGVRERVLFTGMLDCDYKWSALAAARFFVLPSFSEGLSVAALEALSMGLPLIVSEQCHLPEVAAAAAGWTIKTSVEDLCRVLELACQTDDATHAAMSDHARALARDRFSWPSVTRRMAQLYRWVNGGHIPEEVDLLRGSA